MPISTIDTSSISGLGYGFKNRIINGGMVIDQRNAGASVTPNNSYTLDRWSAGNSQTSKFTVQQNAGGITPPAGFSNYLGVTSSSAYSVASGDYFALNQQVEGYNLSDLAWGTANAQTVTLSFWVRSSLTGTFGGVFKNSSGNRSYPFSYVISAANTWEQKAVIVPGDTSGAWLTNNGIGVGVSFGLGVGSTFSGTAGAWAASNLVSATGAVSLVGTSGATFYITGVQLEKGTVATSFDYRPYGVELQLCQRYYQVGVSKLVKQNNDTLRQSQEPVSFMVQMRAAPTLGNTNTASQNVTVAVVVDASVNGFGLGWRASSTIDFVNVFNWTASAELT
jgi:hypothetical protein